MFRMSIRRVVVCAGFLVVAAGAVAAQGVTQPKQGQGGSVVQGAAGTNGSIGIFARA